MGARTGPPGQDQDVTHLRDLFAILQVPHRRGLGGDAGQPPPASGESSRSPTLPPLPSLLFPGGRSGTQAPDRARRDGLTEGRTATRPRSGHRS